MGALWGGVVNCVCVTSSTPSLGVSPSVVCGSVGRTAWLPKSLGVACRKGPWGCECGSGVCVFRFCWAADEIGVIGVVLVLLAEGGVCGEQWTPASLSVSACMWGGVVIGHSHV